MSQQSTATIEDYKKYVKELKIRIKQLTDKNKTINEELKRYETQSGQKMRQNLLSNSIKLTKKAVIIQKFVRRFLARKKLKKKTTK